MKPRKRATRKTPAKQARLKTTPLERAKALRREIREEIRRLWDIDPRFAASKYEAKYIVEHFKRHRGVDPYLMVEEYCRFLSKAKSEWAIRKPAKLMGLDEKKVERIINQTMRARIQKKKKK